MYIRNHTFLTRCAALICLFPLIFGGCGSDSKASNPVNEEDELAPNADAVSYEEMVDPIADEGQYYMPLPPNAPVRYWTCVDIANRSDRNSLGQSNRNYGLQYHLLAQSLAGLVNRALAQGKTDVGIWLEVSGEAYSNSLKSLGSEIGRQTAIELLTNTYSVEGVHANVRELIDGYVLTDVENNPESNIVATVASHVYNSVIVDVRDKAFFDNAGYEMKYDARNKTTADAWREFKDRCSNKALVVMPVQTGELREFAICNDLFLMNLNKQYSSTSGGQNSSIFDEVLAWLQPNAPVLGWEQGVGEDEFVGKVSRYGTVMLASDWSYNHTLTSVCYDKRQTSTLAKVINPRDIDYSKKKNYVSFYLSDGDNYQWVMGDGFVSNFYGLGTNDYARMSFGLCSEALCQLAPARFEQLYSLQRESGTLMETFGGGYFYVDTYSTSRGARKANLKVLAERTAAHMRQHRIKVLHLMAQDWSCSAAREAYQAFIDANDQLEGIVTIQYSPYTAGKGQIIWLTNKKGYDIPVLSTKYSLWKDNANAAYGVGNPKEVAGYIKTNETDDESWSACVVHAWSDFTGARASAAAKGCLVQCPSGVEPVCMQELIWRIRMAKRPEQTKTYLKTIK